MASVLIIDDHQGTLDTYSTILRLAGFETATASNGRAGIDLATSRGFDVHLVDLRLPDMLASTSCASSSSGMLQVAPSS